MVIDVTNITMPMAALLASMIGATATITAAFLQLRIAWRKEMMERATHKPVTKKAKRGPITPVIILLIASAIGGFALSQYLVTEARNKDEALELELRSRIDQLSVSAQSLEKVRLYGEDGILRQVRAEEAQRVGKDGVATIIGVGKCAVAVAEAKTCSEQNALQLQLCAEIPITASVSAIDLYARTDDEPGPWHEKRVVAGKDFGGGRYAEKPTERPINEELKQVCQGMNYWNSEFNLQARMVVRYATTQIAASPVSTVPVELAPASSPGVSPVVTKE
jgi:hypothetical protein